MIKETNQLDDFTVFLDMDGVSVDFVGGVKNLLGEPGKTLDDWGIEEAYGFNEDGFWEKVDTFEFWSTLEPYPGFDDFYKNLNEIVSNVVYCSKPSRHPISASGKLEWMQIRYGKRFRDYILTPQKHYLAKPNTILIDDKDKNVEDFVNAGGKGIVIPQTWNKFADLAEMSWPDKYDRTLKLVKEYM
ncbi:MAG: hypothetical protein K9J12_06195 [Melioribacteraceae bacterium]|nr:hypothetical protein [Melioribacteraceae bacterium]